MELKQLILPLSQNKCCIPTAQVSMVVETLVQLGDKIDHLEINDAAKMQHLFLDRGREEVFCISYLSYV